MTAYSEADRKIMIDSINQERIGLRSELITYHQSLHKCLFIFVTVGGLAATIYFGKGTVLSNFDKPFVLFLLSQVEFLLSLFAMALISAQSMHSGYISALEKRINELVGSKTSFWESEVVPRYMGHPRGSFFWTNLLLVLTFIIIFGVLAFAAGRAIDRLFYGVLLTLEFFVILALMAFSQVDTRRVENFALNLFIRAGG